MPFDQSSIPDLGKAPSASDVILQWLRAAIVAGELKEGEPIRQEEIAGLFNVSKIPVREALKRLEAEGLVLFQKNRGAVVTAFTPSEIAEIFEVRALLEAEATRLSVPNMDAAALERTEACCAAFSAEPDVARWADLNWRFHASIYEHAGRPYQLSLIRSINDRIERYLRTQLALSGGHAAADREHRQILACCKTGDAGAAAGLVRSHIMDACASLLRHLPGTHG